MTGNALGIASIVSAMLLVSLQDAMVKQFANDYALHEIMVVRAGVAFIIILLFLLLRREWRQLRTRNFPFLFARGLLLVIANSAFFMGMAAMPLADNVAIFFIAPLLITALSALMLGEPVGARRWTGVVVGMVGVLAIVRPGADVFQLSAVFPLIAAFAYALMQILARRMGTVESTATMVIYVQLTLVSISALIGLIAGDGRFAGSEHVSVAFALRAWGVPSDVDLSLWVAMGALSAVGTFLMTQGYRVANAAVIAPFEYVAMPFALLWGYWLYAEVPSANTLIGICLVVSSGIYVAHRELRVRERKGVV